jgi:hypothetical protein
MLPRLLLLEALKAHFRANVPASEDDPLKPAFKVRHMRFRNPTKKEMPCVSLRFVGDDAPGQVRGTDGEGLSMAEEVFELGVELVADAEIPPERDEEDGGDVDDGEDPTGLATCSDMIEILMNSLFTEGEEAVTLGGLAWDIRYDGSADDDDVSKPDNVRLAERITLVYRVRAEAPTQILIGE